MLQKTATNSHPMFGADTKSAAPVRTGIASFDTGEDEFLAAHGSKAGASGPLQVMVLDSYSSKNSEPDTTARGAHPPVLVRGIPSQGVRVSRAGVEVDTIFRARYFPNPNQSRVVGKKVALAGDHLAHKHGRSGGVGRKEASGRSSCVSLVWLEKV